MTAWAGIDYDTHAIHVILLHEDGGMDYYPFELGDSEYPLERARDVRPVMPSRRWWDDLGVVAIGIEEQASGNPLMRSSVQKLKMVQGAILSCLPRETLVMPLEATKWRKTIGLAGNATKVEVATFVNDGKPWLMERQDWPQDACDAYCIALAVQKLAVLS